ncbi:MAG: hypothetical protein QGH94_04575 [Phycisphaerae bacterium]|nr:hypothetical protein [Phycisphaerae bacterium]
MSFQPFFSTLLIFPTGGSLTAFGAASAADALIDLRDPNIIDPPLFTGDTTLMEYPRRGLRPLKITSRPWNSVLTTAPPTILVSGHSVKTIMLPNAPAGRPAVTEIAPLLNPAAVGQVEAYPQAVDKLLIRLAANPRVGDFEHARRLQDATAPL